jgi:hypothetical protein
MGDCLRLVNGKYCPDTFEKDYACYNTLDEFYKIFLEEDLNKKVLR